MQYSLNPLYVHRVFGAECLCHLEIEINLLIRPAERELVVMNIHASVIVHFAQFTAFSQLRLALGVGRFLGWWLWRAARAAASAAAADPGK